MKRKTYILNSRLSPDETIARVEVLFAKAGVQYKTHGLSVVSTRTPIPLGIRNQYSNRNWVGLNPFASISGVNVRCRPGKTGLTEVIVQVDRFRTFLLASFWAWAAGMAAVGGMKRDSDIVFVVLGVTAGFVFGWLTQVSLLAGYLLKKEIANSLNTRIK